MRWVGEIRVEGRRYRFLFGSILLVYPLFRRQIQWKKEEGGVGGESAFLHCVDRFSTGCKRVIRRFSPAFVRAPWPSSPAWHFATVFRVHKYLDIFLNNFFWNVLSAFTIYPNTAFPHSLYAVPPSPSPSPPGRGEPRYSRALRSDNLLLIWFKFRCITCARV